MTFNNRYLPAVVPNDGDKEQTAKKYGGGGRSPVAFISDTMWRAIQMNGAMATERLGTLIADPKFMRMKTRDQVALMKLATDLAFKINAPVAHVNVFQRAPSDPTQIEELNALRTLSNLALELPEFKNSPDKDRRN
jgi:hypothetical protein